MVKQLHSARKLVFYLVGWFKFLISLLGIAAIAGLFTVRKFLFLHPESCEKMQRRREYMD